jgi:hypothetical protein
MYEKRVGNLQLSVERDGARDPSYTFGCELIGPAGQTGLAQDEIAGVTRLRLSVEQLHDLRHMIDRALAAVEAITAETR